jgi:hypothetical protein
MAKTKTSWPKGKSGNPKGAPKKENSVTYLLRNISEKDKKEIAEKIVQLCKEGDIRHIKEYLDRADGKVKEQIEHSTDADNPPKMVIEVRNVGNKKANK